jgi:hypothetical protein
MSRLDSSGLIAMLVDISRPRGVALCIHSRMPAQSFGVVLELAVSVWSSLSHVDEVEVESSQICEVNLMYPDV